MSEDSGREEIQKKVKDCIDLDGLCTLYYDMKKEFSKMAEDNLKMAEENLKMAEEIKDLRKELAESKEDIKQLKNEIVILTNTNIDLAQRVRAMCSCGNPVRSVTCNKCVNIKVSDLRSRIADEIIEMGSAIKSRR